MKRLSAFILAMLTLVLGLVGCGTTDTTTLEPTTTETTTYDYERIPDVIEPHEEFTFTPEMLGYEAAVVGKASKYWVAEGKVETDGGVTVTTYNPGTTTVRVKNKYAECIDITLTVGLDYSLESYSFEAYTPPENFVYATDCGMSPSNSDNASYLQNAIDKMAAKGGGTVYIPKGVYTCSLVQLRENVTLRLEGILEEYNTEYTSRLEAVIRAGQLAVIRSAGKGDMFINHTPRGPGREGCDNFSIIGGCLDMIGKNRCMIWCCADNVLLENVIMKDCLADHAIQITGSSNVTIRDCMFAGYNCPTNKDPNYSETIQIEQAHPGAIGSSNPNSTFEKNEYYYCENITIENCYFGPSLNYGSHLTPIGHHGQSADCSARGVKILGCTFVDPRSSAIRPFGWSDVEIGSCTFISNKANSRDPKNRYMIDIKFSVNEAKLPNEAYLAIYGTAGGAQNYSIHDNSFHIGPDSQMFGALACVNTDEFKHEYKGYTNLKVADSYNSKVSLFNGFKELNAVASSISLVNNEIRMENEIGNHAVKINYGHGVLVEGNTVESTKDLITGKLGEQENYGIFTGACTTMDYYRDNFSVSVMYSNRRKPIILMGGEADIGAICTASDNKARDFKFAACEGGSVNRWADEYGNLYVEPVADEGYVFDGYYVNGVRLEGDSFESPDSCTVELRFSAE